MTAVRIVPATVARGIVRSGASMLSAGIVAHSRPRNAHNVRVAVAETVRTNAPELLAAIAKCDVSTMNRPPIPITTSGMIFRTVVTSCTRPAARTPRTFSPVSSQRKPIASAAADFGVRTIDGKKGSR